MQLQPFSDTDVEEVVAKALAQIGDLATLPEVTLKIVETVEDPRSTARDLHEIVTHDLALSARILRVANSAFYGLPGQIASIDRAIVMLGLNAVKNIAIAASMSKLFRGGRISRLYSARDLWVHSVAVGTACKMIVECLRMALPDEAFVGGLIHDIGLVVMLQCHPQRLQELVRLAEQADRHSPARRPVDTFAQLEQRLFGATHEAFGIGLARQWKFPRTFQYLTGHHHQPERLSQGNRLLAQLVYTAEALCSELRLGMVLSVDAHPLDLAMLDELRLGQGKLDWLRTMLPEQVDLARGLFD